MVGENSTAFFFNVLVVVGASMCILALLISVSVIYLYVWVLSVGALFLLCEHTGGI